jgi:signal transduction histidine kinase
MSAPSLSSSLSPNLAHASSSGPVGSPLALSALPAEMLDAIATPIYIKAADHRWVFANRACCQLVGQPLERLINGTESDFIPAHLAQTLRQQDTAFWQSHLQSSQPIIFNTTEGMGKHFCAHRTLMAAQDSSRPDSNHHPEQQWLVVTLQDITDSETLLEFESTLKRITDRVRDSLDEKQILQIAVKELTEALGVRGSNTALYDLEQGTSTVYYEHTTSTFTYRGRVAQMDAFPEVYHQLLEGQHFQFCSIVPNPMRGLVAMLACPILDDTGVMGDLWLIHDKDHIYDDLDIRLVQQVSNQCAIAIRQARLFQESQAQVRELERINTLKDDFLSTVSHELRTPVTSMRVALQLLGVTLNQELNLDNELKKSESEQSRVARYYRILKEECEREIGLINDLLDLQRLDIGNHPVIPQPIKLPDWIPALVKGFQARAKSRDQNLSVSIPSEIPILISDLSSLERILAELMNNACKYTPPGGSICLAVTHSDNNTIQFDITNTGIEIPLEEMHRIFDKFYRVPSADPWKQGGTGLGLALVQKLIGHIEGKIAVTSGDQQTCFTVELPLAISAK